MAARPTVILQRRLGAVKAPRSITVRDVELRVIRFCGPCRLEAVEAGELEELLMPLVRAIARHAP